MRLYKIEAVGFKSFKDKVVIQVPEGIIGIVGPNGCGKSNVVDAIKWALGEQNPRHLRAKSMEDIIFAGTTEFSPCGMAEVSLFFKRGKEPFPEPYSNLTELVITRRYYRSGDSEYLINKSQCRLKDITDITIDTGLGQRFYGLIEQGMIESLMNQKPEEKRLIFEEVAGTAKYRLRKKATLQKLESAKQNLNRVEDILSEVEKRCKELEKEAARAREYKKIFDELKRIELYTNALSYEKTIVLLDSKVKEVHELNKILEEKELETSSLEADLEVKRNELFFQEKNFEEHKKELFTIGESLLKIEKELNAIKEGKGYREKKILELEEQISQLLEKLERLKIEQKELGLELESYKQIMREKEDFLSELEKKENQVSTTIKELSHQTNVLQTEMGKERSQLAYASSQIDYEERLIKDAKERMIILKQEQESQLKELENAKESLSKKKEHIKEKERERDVLLNEIDRLNKNFVNEKKAASEMRRKLQEKELKRERLLGGYNSSKKFIEDYKGLSSGTQYVIKNFKKNEILGALLEHIEIKDELLSAFENFLREKMELLFVSDADVACQAIDYLKKGGLGSCFLLPLTHIVNNDVKTADGELLRYIKADDRFKDVVFKLFSNVKVVKDIREAIERFLSGERCNYLTLEGDILYEGGIISGGSKAKHNPYIMEKARLKELEGELAILNRELEKERELISEKEEVIRNIERDINEKKNELAELDLEISEEKTEIRLEEEEMKRKLLKSENIKQEIRNIEVNLRSYEKKKEELSLNVKKLTADIDAKELLLKEKMAKLEDLKKETDERRGEITSLKVSIAEERRNYQHKRENHEKLLSQINAIQTQIDNLTKEKEAIQKIDNDAQRKLEGFENDYNKLKKEEESLMIKVKEEEELLNRLRITIREKEKALSVLRAELEKNRKSVFNLKEMLNEWELKIKLIEERVREKYFVEISKHYKEYVGFNVSAEECKQDVIEEKWRQLRDMGEVNLLSIDEYEEVKSRYDFLVKQKSDIEASIESLNAAIERINKVSVELFLNAIKAIEENFDKLFKRLFGGGKAKVVLSDENNPLDSGIDIVVEPPFKKFQNIELLSGGEKALVALSLMFAFYMLKPSPFCILDEVDAPLDDANVIKFKELLKEVSQFSQFMVVTHNKTVMESANILYGITMELPGVSKVVSVKTERGEMWQ